jgi:hypothetical protein
VKNCLQGDCLKCGVKNLKICPEELQFDKLINWKNIGYEMVERYMMGRTRKRRKLSTMKLNLKNYCNI